jgi:hypothetical protein
VRLSILYLISWCDNSTMKLMHAKAVGGSFMDLFQETVALHSEDMLR